MLHHLTGGVWGFTIRRMLEAASRTLPLMLLMALPLAFGLAFNYPWAHSGETHVNAQQAMYYDRPFFFARAVLYFAVWLTLMYLLSSWSAAHDRTGDATFVRRAQQLSAPGLIVYGLTVSFAGIDWVMSLDGEWYSSIFGPVVALSQMLPALAVAIVTVTFLAKRPLLNDLAGPAVCNDLGNLLLAFVMLWTYVSFSQFLLIWAGNLPEEIPYYLARSAGGWQFIAVALAVFSFALPFFMLLSREIKRDPASLQWVALGIVAMSFINHFWMIAPAFSPQEFWVDWMDIAAVVRHGRHVVGVVSVAGAKATDLPLHPDAVGEEVFHHA